MRETTKIVGIVGASITGIFTAVITAVSRLQEIRTNKEMAISEIEANK